MAQTFNVRIVEKNFNGLYDSTPGDQLPPGYFSKIDNAFCSDSKINKVFGSTAINTSIAAQPFNGFSSFEIPSSGNKWMVVSINGASNAQLYQSTGGNFSAIGSANLTNSKPVWFETANNILHGFNGYEVVTWDGSSVTKNPSSVPVGFYGKWFHNYLFVGKTTSYYNRLFWSNIGDPTTFNGSNYVDINPGDGDQIMGLCGFPGQDELLVFKRNTIWSITGYSGSSFSSNTVAAQNTNSRINGYGTVAPFSICPVGNDVYFFSMLGNTPVIRSLTKTTNAVTLGGGVISDNIKGTMNNINKTNLSNIVSEFDGRYVYWGVPTGASSVNNQVIALDTWEINKSKGVYPFITMSGKNASYFDVSTIPGYAGIYFADSASSGLVFKFDTSVYTDNGTPITMDVQTRDYSSSLSNKSKWKYLYTTYETGNAATIGISSRIDHASGFTTQDNVSTIGTGTVLGSFVLGLSTLGGGSLAVHRTTFQQVLGHYLGLEFKDTTSNSVSIHDWEILGNTKGLRAS